VPRRTEITEWAADLEDEDLIEREDMVVTVTQAAGHQAHRPERVPVAAAGRQGPVSMQTKEEDVVTRLFVANSTRRSVLH
jgi:DNA gyrase subunit A